jgi:hypothetical protein
MNVGQKKDRQYIGQQKKDGQYIGQKKKDGQYIGQKKNGQYIGQMKKDGQYIDCPSFFDLRLLITPLVSFDQCIVRPSIYGF